MCNFYVMYYVKGDKLPQTNQCFSMGPPLWYFENFMVRPFLQLIDHFNRNAIRKPCFVIL